MSTDICHIYQQLCLKNNVMPDECILSCLNNASKNGKLNLGCTTITDTNCLLIMKTLKHMPTLKLLNLSDCLLSFNGLKNILDVVNQLEYLSCLNLKGNQIGNNSTIYISKIILTNTSITDLQLDWNNMGDSVEAFAHLCNSLTSNTVLNTLNLTKNNLCETCGFYLAKMLNINKHLKNIDLSWNNIGEAGAMLLFKSLKENNIILELNIRGNCVSMETCEMIVEQLKQNNSNEMNQKDIQNRNSSLMKHLVSVNKNSYTQINNLTKEYQNHIDELYSKLHFFQTKNEQQKLELNELKMHCLKENENKKIISNQVEKMESELFLKKQSFNSLIKKISNGVSHSDEETINTLEDFEKIIFIIKQIEKKCTDKILKETEAKRQLLDALSKLKDELNAIKTELKNIKTSTEIKIQNYFEEMTAITKLLLSNISYLKTSYKMNNEFELSMKDLVEQEEEIITVDQKKLLVLLDTKLITLQKENTDLQRKLSELEIKKTLDTQTVQALENSLMLAKDELRKFNEKQLSNIAVQNMNTELINNTLTKEIETLKINLFEKDQKLQLYEIEKHKMNINYTTELSKLQNQLQCEKHKFKQKKKEDQKQLEELYLNFTQYIDKIKNDNLVDINCDN